MINALGLLEVDGMVAAVDAADAMLKAANVRLLSHQVLDPGRLTLVVEGDLAACRARWMPEAPPVVRRWMPEAPPRSAQAV
ncbi:Ethanolamine utilization polyhedral-body-like protein EutK [Salmonella enterica subsp. enterica serovar Urbana str. R8-2977]|uniref:Ethanolamine utilization polyhedral-body-like protein EutK n=1 Tax=Salmonella enterica subsp. enterica serovar Urbana str. R8-2977 TaxID=913084 RepID=G5RYK6_SALET|nr:Ethanolamine utilization polyhedral-body-like protein EutK [Salmonella enterica subsp. enterica serovar Urbana str. R8-2977]